LIWFNIRIINFNKRIRASIIISWAKTSALKYEASNIAYFKPSWRWIFPSWILFPIYRRVFFEIINWQFNLNHSCIILMFYLIMIIIFNQLKPFEFRISILEIANIPFPEANWNVSIHEKNINSLHFTYWLVRTFEYQIFESFTPSTVIILCLNRFFSLYYKFSNLYFYIIFLRIRKTYSWTYFSDDLILFQS
jgi:hypothetical protein